MYEIKDYSKVWKNILSFGLSLLILINLFPLTVTAENNIKEWENRKNSEIVETEPIEEVIEEKVEPVNNEKNPNSEENELNKFDEEVNTTRNINSKADQKDEKNTENGPEKKQNKETENEITSDLSNQSERSTTDILPQDNDRLSLGLRHSDVVSFKEKIMHAGFGTHWTNPNNYFGPETEQIVKDFQAYYNLEVTGVGDTATLNQLDLIVNSPYQLGHSSSEIKAIKTDLMKLGFASQDRKSTR